MEYKLIWSTRIFLALLAFFGCAVMYSLRANLSVAIVCMVNKTHHTPHMSNVSSECGTSTGHGDTEISLPGPMEIGEFTWDKRIQGNILGAFFWGYLFTQILGGWAAQRYGAKKILLINVVVSIIATMFTPLAAKLHYTALMILRILMGLVQASMYPGFIVLWTRWAPPVERSKLTSFTFAGMQIGNVISMPVASYLCSYGFAGGWPSVFYTAGMASVAWAVVWLCWASDTPSKHKYIAEQEVQYIHRSLGVTTTEPSHESITEMPWVSIFKSIPVWACFAAHYAGDWNGYVLLTCLPLFLNEVLQFDMTKLGFVASIPYLGSLVGTIMSGIIADFLIEKRWLSVLNVRKLMTGLSLTVQGVCLVGAGYCRCGQELLAIALITIGTTLGSFQCSGYSVNYMEIAPRYSGFIVGVGNTISCTAGILGPIVMSAMTPHHTRTEWLSLFYVTAGILISGASVFCIFAKSDVQPWAKEMRLAQAEEMVELKNEKTAL